MATATPCLDQQTACTPTLFLAFELGENTWKLGFTTGAARYGREVRQEAPPQALRAPRAGPPQGARGGAVVLGRSEQGQCPSAAQAVGAVQERGARTRHASQRRPLALTTCVCEDRTGSRERPVAVIGSPRRRCGASVAWGTGQGL
jgi:hypothetical protein